MGYTPNLDDKNSPYYYGVDSTYKPPSRKNTRTERKAVASPLLKDDPELQGYGIELKTRSTAKPQQSSGSVVRMGGKEYNMSDPKQKAAYEAAQKAELERQRSRSPMADIRGGDGLKPDGSGRFSPPPTANPNGVQQTGTNTGFKGAGFAEANGLLARLGVTTSRYGDFQSNDLPGVDNTGGSKNLSNDDFILQAQAGGYLDDFKGGSNDDAILHAQGKGFKPVMAKQTEGSPKLTQSGVKSTTKPVETAPLGSVARYGQEFMADRPDMPAQYSTSMVGLRAAEASKGLLYASGKYWKANPNAGGEGEKDFVEIDKAEWNNIKRGNQYATDYKPPAENIADTDTTTDVWKQTAQDFKNDYVNMLQQQAQATDPKLGYTIADESRPNSPIDSTAAVDTNVMRNAPTLTSAVDVRFTDKDRTGRYNNFNNR